MFRSGRGYINSNAVKTSVANANIVDDLPVISQGDNGVSIYRITVMNTQACTMNIIKNGSVVSTAYVGANVGWHMDSMNKDEKIDNIQITTAGITFSYQGGYEYNTGDR